MMSRLCRVAHSAPCVVARLFLIMLTVRDAFRLHAYAGTPFLESVSGLNITSVVLCPRGYLMMMEFRICSSLSGEFILNIKCTCFVYCSFETILVGNLFSMTGFWNNS